MQQQKTEQEKIENRIDNMKSEVENIRKDAVERGIKTKYRYEEGMNRFCDFLGKNYKLQSVTNIRPIHLYKYVDHMKEKGLAGKTIRTDLSGIRFIYKHSSGSRELPTNNKLDLPKNNETVDRAWNKDEVEMAKDVANAMGRVDVAMGITLGKTYGMRIEEAVKCQVNHLKEALSTGELYIKGKNGQIRYVKLHSKEQNEVAKQAIDYAKSFGRRGTDKVLVSNFKGSVKTEKKSIQNWLQNHRGQFIDKSREWSKQIEKWKERSESAGYKFKSSTLNFHGLRYAYAQELYKELKEVGYSEREARLRVSECLGHHRERVTAIYLAELLV